MQLVKLKKQTHTCKSCFKDIRYNSFHSLINSEVMICDDCLYYAKPIFKDFRIDGVKGLAIYEYNSYIRSKMFTYKICEDYELKDFFLAPYKLEFSLLYFGYIVVPIPSYKLDDERRGYNHVIEIFKCLKLQMITCLIKTEDIKQKLLNYDERQEIGKHFKFDSSFNIKNKKILLVDDVITTGASMKAAIKILKENGAKKIKILSICKRELSDEEKKHLKNVSIL
jgi:competence protein ComFC